MELKSRAFLISREEFFVYARETTNPLLPVIFALEQSPECIWLPVHYHQLTADISFPLPLIGQAVTNIHHLEMKTFKDTADIGMIIDADHHLSLATPHEVSNALVVLKGKVHTVACCLPVRRIHIVKCVGTVVAFGAVQPGQVFNVGTGQPLPRCR